MTLNDRKQVLSVAFTQLKLSRAHLVNLQQVIARSGVKVLWKMHLIADASISGHASIILQVYSPVFRVVTERTPVFRHLML